jgi:phospholipid/cholesterol/gamma-HCH transport system ATP-binding protein
MIEVREVSKSFGRHKVLDSCSLKITAGETLVIIGQSGGGKSVLLKHIAGLLEPDSGGVYFDGKALAAMSMEEKHRRALKMGYLFQGAALFDSLTVGENVTFALRRYTKHSESRLKDIAEERLNWVGLRGIQAKKPAELSGGMRKRVGLARAIAMDPEVMLYDEPTTGLDPITADAINDLILQLQDRLKMTSIAVTHDMTSAYKIGDRIAMLYQGGIVQSGTVRQIRQSKNKVIRQFIHGKASGPIKPL